MVKRLAAKQEVVVFFTIVGLGLVIGLVNPAFFTAGHLFNLINSSVVILQLEVGNTPCPPLRIKRMLLVL